MHLDQVPGLEFCGINFVAEKQVLATWVAPDLASRSSYHTILVSAMEQISGEENVDMLMISVEGER